MNVAQLLELLGSPQAAVAHLNADTMALIEQKQQQIRDMVGPCLQVRVKTDLLQLEIERLERTALYHLVKLADDEWVIQRINPDGSVGDIYCTSVAAKARVGMV